MSYIKKAIVRYENSFIKSLVSKTSKHKAITKNVGLESILIDSYDKIKDVLKVIDGFVNQDKLTELHSLVKIIDFSDSITNDEANKLELKAIKLSNELLIEFYTFRSVENLKIKKRKKNDDSQRLEKQLLCVSNRISNNTNILNYYKKDNITYKTISNYRCGLKNCLFCKRSKLLKNALNHNIQKIDNVNVNAKKLFITVSVDICHNDIDLEKKALKFKQNLKTYFDNKDFKFFAMIEVANKLHCHIIFFDIQFYSFDIIASELRGLFGYTYIEKLKTENENDRGVFDYVSKVFEYISKTYKSDEKNIDIQNFMITDKNTFNMFLYLKDLNIENVINAFNSSLNENNIIEFLENLRSDFLKKYEVKDGKSAMRFLLKKFISKYSFLITKVFDNYKKHSRHLKDLSILKSNLKNEKINLFEFKEINKEIENKFKEIQDYKNKVAYSVWKNFFISKLKYYFELSKTFGLIYKYNENVIDNETKEVIENQIKIFSSWFVTSKFKRIFFTNIKIVEKKTNIIINNNIVKFSKTKQTKKKIENINNDVIEFKKENTLTISKNVKNDASAVANIFYKNSILKKNNGLKLDDFGQVEYIELINIIVENKTRKSLNKFKSNHSENEYNARFEIIKKQTLKKIMGKIYAFYGNKKK